MNIKQKIDGGENRKLEFKEKLPSKNQLIKTAIAFANGSGGEIIIGVEDNKKEIVGLPDELLTEYIDQISNAIYDTSSPAIIPEIVVETVDNKSILIIRIFPGNLTPYHIKSKDSYKGTYIRVGATNKIADKEIIRELERRRINVSFDEDIFYSSNIDNLNFEKLQKDFHDFTEKKLGKNDLFLLKLAKVQRDRPYPTNAGMLIAGRERVFDYAVIQCARFKGTTNDEFIDRKEFSGSLYNQVEYALKFAQTHIKLAGKIENVQRKDTYEIPLLAIREALINAVVHRDYSISGSDIKFAIFDDRIEITSPGVLPKTLDISELAEGRSVIRNKIIARFFKEIGFIEQWGTGIPKIYRTCRGHGLAEPEFRESGMFFKVILSKQSSDKVAIGSDKVAIGSDKSVLFNRNEKIILNYLQTNTQITNSAARRITSLSSPSVRKIFVKLTKNGIIKAVGNNKNRYYVLLDV